MKDFTYCIPTKIVFGKGVCDTVGETLKTYGPKKVLVLYGGGSAKRSGLIDRITASLDAAGIASVEFSGVDPNPNLNFVYKTIDFIKKEEVDFILAVGGGSVIDTAKCAGLALANDADPWAVTMGEAEVKNPFPFACVLTISAAGSEMGDCYVITNTDIPKKKGKNHPFLRPLVSFMDPGLTCSVSKFQTGCGIVDIMAHTLERYMTPDADSELTDRIAEAILLSVKNAGTAAIKDPEDYEARATLMWGSSLSHNDLTGLGRTRWPFPAHQLEHGVSAYDENIAHGAGLSVIYPAMAKYIYKNDVRRFAQFAVRVMGVPMDFDHPEVTALRGIEALKAYFASLDMPVTMQELGLSEKDYGPIADLITAGDTMSIMAYVPLKKQDIINIFKLAE